jgi:hypothetical protein
MLYNRHSIYVFNRWIKHALLKGRPWKSLSRVLHEHMESVGTKGYTRRELGAILQSLPLKDITVHTEVTSGDYLSSSAFLPLRCLNRLLLKSAGYNHDWSAVNYVERGASSKQFTPPAKLRYTGNCFGFNHCISAVKS